jgi:hypothetical protein
LVTQFPQGLDQLTNPFATDPMTAPAHHGQHTDINDAVEAMQRPILGPPWNNVKAFGARGDGANDDTSAIQAAGDALPSSGGAVYFPPGTYMVQGVTTSRPTLYTGCGRASVLKRVPIQLFSNLLSIVTI